MAGRRVSTARVPYSLALVEKILERIANGEGLNTICRDTGMPPESTFRGWVIDDHEGLAAKYTRAREMQAHRFVEEQISIADQVTALDRASDHPAKAKLQIDARRWYASKVLPKVYGDKIAVEHDIGDNMAARMEAARKRLPSS